MQDAQLPGMVEWLMAKDLFLKRIKNGLIAETVEAIEGVQAYPEGVTVRVKVTQPRVLAHHRFYFAFTGEVFEDVKDSYRISFSDVDEFRGWLLVRAGFFHSTTQSFSGFKDPFHLISLLKAILKDIAYNKTVWWAINPEIMAVTGRWARSVAFHKMDEDEFRSLTAAVFSFIYSEFQIDVDDYYKSWAEENGCLKVVPEKTIRGSAG